MYIETARNIQTTLKKIIDWFIEILQIFSQQYFADCDATSQLGRPYSSYGIMGNTIRDCKKKRKNIGFLIICVALTAT